MKYDVIVLGAGIVGISTALHLRKQGLNVLLVDKQEIGKGASGGNAGMLVRAGLRPYAFPFNPSLLLRSISKRFGGFNYHTSFLLKNSGWLANYAWHSRTIELQTITTATRPLIESCIDEHLQLARAANTSHLLKHSGWLCVYRRVSAFRSAIKAAHEMSKYGLSFKVLEAKQLAIEYPINVNSLVGAIVWHDQYFCTDPQALVNSYAKLFLKLGGVFKYGDARKLEYKDGIWSLRDNDLQAESEQLVLAMGAYSDVVYERLGYKFPMLGKRGYHMHYESSLAKDCIIPITDVENGYVMAPMAGGLRITTGVELAPRDAKSTPEQLIRIEKTANDIVQLGKRLDPQPWLGIRPCLPDMLPVIGAGHKHKGLWFNFGHNHIGFSIGPGSGRLLSDLIVNKKSAINALPFSPQRF